MEHVHEYIFGHHRTLDDIRTKEAAGESGLVEIQNFTSTVENRMSWNME